MFLFSSELCLTKVYVWVQTDSDSGKGQTSKQWLSGLQAGIKQAAQKAKAIVEKGLEEIDNRFAQKGISTDLSLEIQDKHFNYPA